MVTDFGYIYGLQIARPKWSELTNGHRLQPPPPPSPCPAPPLSVPEWSSSRSWAPKERRRRRSYAAPDQLLCGSRGRGDGEEGEGVHLKVLSGSWQRDASESAEGVRWHSLLESSLIILFICLSIYLSTYLFVFKWDLKKSESRLKTKPAPPSPQFPLFFCCRCL